MTLGGYAASSSGSLSSGCSSAGRPLSVMGLARVRIARMVPCETWAAAAIAEAHAGADRGAGGLGDAAGGHRAGLRGEPVVGGGEA